NEMHRDINASINILNRALESFELGINSLDYKQQALCVS
ncbi:transposase, partial [Campylobacter jejuni]|nr:transposase [Campylobacter jejuni]